MRIFVFVFFLCCSVFSFAQVPDTSTERWSNGRLKSVKIFLEGKENGTWTSYNEFGVLIHESNYQGGKLHGRQARFAGNGNQILLEYFKNGLQDSIRIVWFPDGHLQAEENYSNGKREGLSRSFFYDGRTHSYAYYQNELLEGRFFEANAEGITVQEGWARHGKWVWYRKFCDNKLCEIHGLDTISGTDSIRYFNPKGYLVRKQKQYSRYEVPAFYEVKFNTDGDTLLFYCEEADAYWFRKTSKYWSDGADSLRPWLRQIQTDSCLLSDYLHRSDSIGCRFAVLIRSFHAPGKLASREYDLNGKRFQELYSIEGNRTEQGYRFHAGGIKTGFWLVRFRDSDSLWYEQHVWYLSGLKSIDTVFYPSGKIRSVQNGIGDEDVLNSFREFSSEGNLLYEEIYYADAGSSLTRSFYADGSPKLFSRSVVSGSTIHKTVFRYDRSGKQIYHEESHLGKRNRSEIEQTDSTGLKETIQSVSQKKSGKEHVHIHYVRYSASGIKTLESDYVFVQEYNWNQTIRRGKKICFDQSGNKSVMQKLKGLPEIRAKQDCSASQN